MERGLNYAQLDEQKYIGNNTVVKTTGKESKVLPKPHSPAEQTNVMPCHPETHTQ